ncbi:unnamed protein product [Brassicogethes aeneus]|uniref:Uncharacterized protein n=1 Tax=Brassicogethes aeneus TaxID=1431903 RepID=A0A9P0B7L8_BRAAE|nr:unnamed protein product [Brassicogethes aeneus]
MRAFIFILCLSVALASPRIDKEAAAACSSDVCKANCRCSSSISPLDLDKTPQLISLTFDEAIVENLYDLYWEKILTRDNPDDQQIGATFFIPHEYTEYDLVSDLYNFGYEIGVHSITKTSDQEYWRESDLDTLKQEFGGERYIISKFANIPEEDLIGVRTPQLQLNGNVSIQAYTDSNLQYDSSWPTLPNKPLFPYTLDFLTTQDCGVAEFCPNEAFKGFWILPIVDLNNNGNGCNNLADCGQNGTVNEIKAWLNNQLIKVKETKVPLTLRIGSYWFEQAPNALEAFTSWLDDLKTQEDVFLVTQKQVLEWIKNPVELSQFKTDVPDRDRTCKSIKCGPYTNEYGKTIYMKSCIECPPAYPWLGNPDGNKIN